MERRVRNPNFLGSINGNWWMWTVREFQDGGPRNWFVEFDKCRLMTRRVDCVLAEALQWSAMLQTQEVRISTEGNHRERNKRPEEKYRLVTFLFSKGLRAVTTKRQCVFQQRQSGPKVLKHFSAHQPGPESAVDNKSPTLHSGAAKKWLKNLMQSHIKYHYMNKGWKNIYGTVNSLNLVVCMYVGLKGYFITMVNYPNFYKQLLLFFYVNMCTHKPFMEPIKFQRLRSTLAAVSPLTNYMSQQAKEKVWLIFAMTHNTWRKQNKLHCQSWTNHAYQLHSHYVYCNWENGQHTVELFLKADRILKVQNKLCL